MSQKNKSTRESQQNGTHSTGSRSFAVVHNQMVKMHSIFKVYKGVYL